MSKMIKKTLLIYPPWQFDHLYARNMSFTEAFVMPPLNLMYLVASVPDHDVDIIDMNTDPNWTMENIKDKIKDYDLVGLSCMSTTLKPVVEICKICKKIGIKTLVGGYHPTLAPSVIDEIDCIDMIIRGEGEFAFKELLDGKPMGEILGLSYRENEELYHNPDRLFIKNMDDLPYPSNDALPQKPYNILGVSLWNCETTRGCPFKCNFCSVTSFNKGTYRKKSPERVIEELKRVPQGVNIVWIIDDNFTLVKSRVMRICELIQENELNKRFAFICQSRVEDIANNPDMVKEMAKSGFGVIFLGIESFNQKALDQMHKQYSVELTRTTIKLCHENGICVWGSIIIGNIGENKEDVKKNIKLLKKLKIDFLLSTAITAFPGTPLNTDAVEKGWMDKNFRWEEWDLMPMMDTPDLTRKEITKLNEICYETFYGIVRLPFFTKNLLTYMIQPKYSWSRGFILRAMGNLGKMFMIPEVKEILGEFKSLGGDVLSFVKKLLPFGYDDENTGA